MAGGKNEQRPTSGGLGRRVDGTQLRVPPERSDDVTIAADRGRLMTGMQAPMRAARLAVCACVAAGMFVAMPLRAQSVDPGLITAITLDASQQQRVREFAAPLAAGLKSNDQKQIQAARAAILEPMGNAAVSVQFRQEMSRALFDTLRDVLSAEAGNDQASSIGAINATIIAGELATESTSGLLTDTLKSRKADLRYQAAMGIRRTFEAMQTTAPAVGAQRAQSLVQAIDLRIKEETDPLVLDALIRAGLAAAELTNEQFRDVRSRGIEVVAGGAAVQLKRREANPLDAASADALIRAGTGVRDALANRISGAAVNELAVKSVAELGGHLIAHSAKVVQAQGLRDDAELRERYAQISQLGETLVMTSAQSFNNATVEGKQLGQTLRQATTQGDAKFALDAREIAGPDGYLTRAPFNFARDAFFQR